jgi:Domain of unknown function (DUF543)
VRIRIEDWRNLGPGSFKNLRAGDYEVGYVVLSLPHFRLPFSQQIMSSADSSSSTASLSSDAKLPRIMQMGAEKMVVQGTIGLLIGFSAGIVLSRGGGSGTRKIMAGLGAGFGIGSGWTKTSMEIDDFLSSGNK